MAKDTQVTVKFLSDTKGYVKGVKEAEKSTDNLNKSIKKTGDEQQNVATDTGILKSSVDELGGSLRQTSESLVDSATGFTGLGSALSKVGASVKTAVQGLGAFSKALLATGIGAAVIALAAIVVYWEEISNFIGLSNKELNKMEQNLKDIESTTLIVNAGLQSTLDLTLKISRGEEDAFTRGLQREQLLNEREEATQRLLTLDAKLADLENGVFFGVFGRGEAEAEELRKKIEETELQIQSYTTQISLLSIEQQQANEDTEAATEALNKQRDAALNVAAALRQARLALNQLEGDEIQNAELNGGALQQIKEDGLTKLRNMAKANIDDRIVDNSKLIDSTKTVTAAQVAGMNAVFGLGASLAEDNKQLQGSLLIAQAISNTAVGITAATKIPLTAPFMIPAIAAIGVAQVATIIKNMGGSAEGGISAPAIATQSSVATESASPDFFRTNQSVTQPQTVLVVEDYTRAANLVAVKEDRASLG